MRVLRWINSGEDAIVDPSQKVAVADLMGLQLDYVQAADKYIWVWQDNIHDHGTNGSRSISRSISFSSSSGDGESSRIADDDSSEAAKR